VRADFTRMHVIENKNMRVVRKKNNNNKKLSVINDDFKVIF
jgi:hypothetical protein